MDYLNYIALDYFGKTITYRELFKHIDDAAKAFQAMGVSKGSVVTIMSMQTPETIYSIYALNRLGAIANLIYVTLTEDELVTYIEMTNSVLFMYFEVASEKIKKIKNRIRIPMIVLSLSDSMPWVKRGLVRIKKKLDHEGMSFHSFIKEGTEIKRITDAESDGDTPAVIVYTSGTTGEPKGVVHTNRSLNAIPFQYCISNMELNHGDTFLNAIPPFLGFGISVGMHTQLCLGTHGILQIVPEARAVAKCFIKRKPMHMIVGPAFVTAIIDICKGDMSWLKTLAGGGGAISEEQETELNRRLKKCNCSLEYITGYGMTEFGATVCTNMNRCKRYRSLGIPFAKANVKVIDIESKQELKYGQVGEIYFSTPSLMKGYWGRADNEDFIIDNGEKWFATGDLGHVDEDGFVFFDGRIKRIFITRDVDGTVYKVFPQRIEEAIMSHPAVELCGTVGREDKERTTVMISFVKMKSNSSCVSKEEILRFLSYKLSIYAMPEDIVFVDEIPTTQSGKIDYRELEKH